MRNASDSSSPDPVLLQRLRQWAEARARHRSIRGPQAAVAEESRLIRGLGACAAAVWDCSVRTSPEDWEEALDQLPGSDRWAAECLRSQAFQTETRPDHPSGLPVSQTWFLPFAFWDARRDPLEKDAPPPALDLFHRLEGELSRWMARVRRLGEVGNPVSARILMTPPLDLNLLQRHGWPAGDLAEWSRDDVEVLALRRGEWLNAGLLPLHVRAQDAPSLGWIADLLHDDLTLLAEEITQADPNVLLGFPVDGTQGLANADLQRWHLWSDAALDPLRRASDARLEADILIYRDAASGSPLRLKCSVRPGTVPEIAPFLWESHLDLYGDDDRLRESLSAWVGVSDHRVSWRMSCVLVLGEVSGPVPQGWLDSGRPQGVGLH